MSHTYSHRLASLVLMIVCTLSVVSAVHAQTAGGGGAAGGGQPQQGQQCPADQQPCNGRCIPETSICILEPLPGGTDEIPSSSIGLGAFLMYVNTGVWQIIFRMGVAIAVLNGVIGGFQIVLSNDDSGKVDAGKNRFIGSAIGLIILLLTGTILAFLNPVGFVSP